MLKKGLKQGSSFRNTYSTSSFFEIFNHWIKKYIKISLKMTLKHYFTWWLKLLSNNFSLTKWHHCTISLHQNMTLSDFFMYKMTIWLYKCNFHLYWMHVLWFAGSKLIFPWLSLVSNENCLRKKCCTSCHPPISHFFYIFLLVIWDS